MGFTLLAAVLLGQIVAPPPILPGSSITWDAVTTDVAGNPDNVVKYLVVATLATATAPNATNVVKSQEVLAVDVPKIDSDSFLIPLVPGAYKIFVKAIDESENESGWSDPLVRTWDRVAPTVPQNLLLTR